MQVMHKRIVGMARNSEDFVVAHRRMSYWILGQVSAVHRRVLSEPSGLIPKVVELGLSEVSYVVL